MQYSCARNRRRPHAVHLPREAANGRAAPHFKPNNIMSSLATLQDGDLIKRIEGLAQRLNEDPKKEWLQKTPDGKAEYIPIGIIENQLRQDFMGLVQFQVVSERRELNEYIVVARITVFNPVIQQWMHYDGI